MNFDWFHATQVEESDNHTLFFEFKRRHFSIKNTTATRSRHKHWTGSTVLPLGLAQPKEQPRLLQQLSRLYLLPFPRKKLGYLRTWTPQVFLSEYYMTSGCIEGRVHLKTCFNLRDVPCCCSGISTALPNSNAADCCSLCWKNCKLHERQVSVYTYFFFLLFLLGTQSTCLFPLHQVFPVTLIRPKGIKRTTHLLEHRYFHILNPFVFVLKNNILK